MKVYALCDAMPYEEWWIVELFSSEEKREAYIQANNLRTKITKQLKVYYFLDEYEVDRSTQPTA